MLADLDLFFLWRRILVIACTVYAVVRLGQAIYEWRGRLSGEGRHLSMARQYLLVHLLRLPVRRFAWDLLHLAALGGALLLLAALHATIAKQ